MKTQKFKPHQPQYAPYACLPWQSRGRLYEEEESNTRSPFQRDRDRIIHSVAFRRLEYKTQVFVNHEGDHYRTRLTHSLEVSQLARSLCRSLALNEDIGEALALAHDLGHTPFGHAGEDVLAEEMQPYGGFSHNGHSIKLVTSLERRYVSFNGLNLTWETLEGIAKHNGPIPKNAVPTAIAEYNKKHNLELNTYASLEAQVAALADDIAYNNHDIDDGLRAGLFSIADLDDVPGVGEMFRAVKKQHPHIAPYQHTHETIRRLINQMCYDLLSETSANIADAKVKTVEDVRHLKHPLAAFSAKMEKNNKALKTFLMQHMYRHYKVNRMTSKARRIVRDLFTFFMAEPECLPTEWRLQAQGKKAKEQAVLVADYIAGMTDRFAISEHKRIFDMSTLS